jgi:hypothetical protein
MGAVNHDLRAVSPFAVPMPTYPLGFGGFYTVPFLFDWAALKASQAWTLNPNAPDTLVFTTIPIGAQIHGVLFKVVDPITDAGTILMSVGDFSSASAAIDADGYLGSTPLSIKAAGYGGTVLADAYAAATKVYSAAAYLGILFSGSCTEITTGRMWLAVKMSFTIFPDLSVLAPALWH